MAPRYRYHVRYSTPASPERHFKYPIDSMIDNEESTCLRIETLVLMDEKWSEIQDTFPMGLGVCAILFRIDRSKGVVTITRDSASVVPILDVATYPSDSFAYVAVLIKEDLRYRLSGDPSLRYFYRQKLERAKEGPFLNLPTADESDSAAEQSDLAAKENNSAVKESDTAAELAKQPPTTMPTRTTF